jgi:hypothetical protein
MNALVDRSLYPSEAILSNWVEFDWDRTDGVQVDRCDDLDRLIVRTHNSVYELIVQSAAGGSVYVRGGRFFPQFTEAELAGSSLGGSFLKLRGIYVGLRMELFVDGETIITSPVTSISVASVSGLEETSPIH